MEMCNSSHRNATLMENLISILGSRQHRSNIGGRDPCNLPNRLNQSTRYVGWELGRVQETVHYVEDLILPGRGTIFISVRETVCNNSKNVKSHVFLKSEKTEKNVKKRRPTAYVQFHRPLSHSAFNTQLAKPKLSTCTGKSPTSHTTTTTTTV